MAISSIAASSPISPFIQRSAASAKMVRPTANPRTLSADRAAAKDSRNVSIEASTGLRIGYAKMVTLRQVRVTTAHGQPLLLEDTVEALRQSN